MKYTIKLLFILLSVIMLCAAQSVHADEGRDVIGILTYLNFSEEEYAAYVQARIKFFDHLMEKGYFGTDIPAIAGSPDQAPLQVVFYESLGEMLMDLNAGRLDNIEISQSTAEYICSRNPQMFMPFRFDTEMEGLFDKAALERMSDGFAFMMMDYNTPLRDLFNSAISAMKEDGTLDELILKYITEINNGGKIPSVPLEHKEGRETITVAVTGSLPPMDYIGPDGSNSGFNTAVLSEIGERLNVNIELIQVDIIGRAAALSSGAADVAFWTRGTANPEITEMKDEEYSNYVNELRSQYSEEENEIMIVMSEILSRKKLDERDMPERTIITYPYFTDISVPVRLKNQ